MKPQTKHFGFSLLELLFVLALVGILGVLALNSFGNFANSSRMREAQNALAQAINKARSESRRTSTDQTVTWTLNASTLVIAGKNFDLPNSITLTGPTSGSFSYSAPYGRINPNTDTEFVLQDKRGYTKKVRVQGVTGRVVQVNE